MTRIMIIATLFAGAAVLPVFAEGAAFETAGKVDAVTVYRGQALVTRAVDLSGSQGLREVIVTDLPARIVPGSLHAQSVDGIEVRSVRYRERPVGQDVRAEVRELDRQLRARRDELEAVDRARRLESQKSEYLDQLANFTTPTTSLELTHGVLNADTLEQMTLFAFAQREKLKDALLQLDMERRDLGEHISLLERRRDKLTGGSARTVREAVVFINQTEGAGTLRLRYLVEDATWSPSYNVRANGDRTRATLEYNAAIEQRSGEDWTDVAMTLSTATPTLVARAPKLAPLKVSLTDQPGAMAGEAYQQQLDQLQQRLQQVEGYRNAPFKRKAGGQRQLAPGQMADSPVATRIWAEISDSSNVMNLNRAAADLQLLDLATSQTVRQSAAVRGAREEGISVTYALAGRTTLPSRSDQQSLQICELELPASFYKVATPVLTQHVYDEAELVNDSKMVLLAGPVSAFAGGVFVGHDEMPTVAAGESLVVGFGIDASLRSTRTLASRKEQVRGGNRVVTFKYRMAIANFDGAPVAVRLLDRLPQSKGSQVQVTLVDEGLALSDTREYLSGSRKDGILRWDVDVPPAAGLDAVTFDYEFQLEYDRAKSITQLADAG